MTDTAPLCKLFCSVCLFTSFFLSLSALACNAPSLICLFFLFFAKQMASSAYIDGFLHYFQNSLWHPTSCMSTNSLFFSSSLALFLLLLICALSSFPLMLLNNGETACSSHAVTQPVRSRGPAVNTYVRVHVCVCLVCVVGLSVCMLKISLEGTAFLPAATHTHTCIYSKYAHLNTHRSCNQL